MGTSGARVLEQFQSPQAVPTPRSAISSFSLFSPVLERAQMVVPLVLLTMALAEILYTRRFFSDEALLLGFIQNILFLNSLHVLLTYLTLFGNQSGRAWFNATGSITFKLRCMFVFAFFFGLYFFYREIAPAYRGATSLIDGVMIFAGRHHEIAQSRGIGLLYDSKFKSEVKTEHRLYPLVRTVQSVFGISSAAFSFLTLNTYQPYSPIYDYAAKTFKSPMYTWLWVGTFITSLLCILLLFASSHILYKPGFRKKKFLFNLRFPIKLLSYHSSIAAFFSNSTHGIEYLAVCEKLDGGARTVSKRKFIAVLTLSVAVFIVFRYAFVYAPYFGISDKSSLITWAMSLIAGLTFLHYFLDANIFLHREPNSKKLIIDTLRS